MAGMFNAPCCGTCAHERRPAEEGNKRAVCALHGKQLPVWLREWKSELVLCSKWRHYANSGPPDPMRGAFPDSSVLYCYPNEYSGDKRKLVALAELPDAA